MADGVSYQAAVERHRAAPDEGFVRAALGELRSWGIGYFRDGGDKYGVSRFAKTLAAEYAIDYRTPVFIIHREGYYGHLYGRAYRDMREARALIADAKTLGADFVKITVSGMLDFDTDGSVLYDAIGGDEIHELVNIAEGEGFRVMAHCNGAANIKNALEAGIASLEHGYWIDREGVEILRETGVVWVPTCAPVKNVLSDGRYPEKTMRRILAHHAEMIRYAGEAGALVASGSDSGAYGVPHGRGTGDEYAYLGELGIDPVAANEKIARLFVRA
jgi:imidazolonepropionase-like amidohydrolase